MKRRTAATTIRDRLDEAEATLDAIRTGRVDALVISGPHGDQTRTIEGGARPYFVLLDAMSDGAALLTLNGEVLFANHGLSEMTGRNADALRGSTLRRMVIPAERAGVAAFLRDGSRQITAREFRLVRKREVATPVSITLSVVSLDAVTDRTGPTGRSGETVLMGIITDLTYRNAADETRTRLLERLISAEDDERRRVARELHDEAGQSLTAIMMGLRAIADMAMSADVRSSVMRLRDVTAHTIDDVGRLARGLHPAILDDKGLGAAAKRYVADFSHMFGVVVDLTTRRLDSPRLVPLTAATMYRILQECLTNVGRHSKAKCATVALSRDAHHVELVVRDDGIGFETSVTGDRLGLRGMRERVALSQGVIKVESKPGHGAMVRVRLPVASRTGRAKTTRRRAVDRKTQ